MTKNLLLIGIGIIIGGAYSIYLSEHAKHNITQLTYQLDDKDAKIETLQQRYNAELAQHGITKNKLNQKITELDDDSVFLSKPSNESKSIELEKKVNQALMRLERVKIAAARNEEKLNQQLLEKKTAFFQLTEKFEESTKLHTARYEISENMHLLNEQILKASFAARIQDNLCAKKKQSAQQKRDCANNQSMTEENQHLLIKFDKLGALLDTVSRKLTQFSDTASTAQP